MIMSGVSPVAPMISLAVSVSSVSGFSKSVVIALYMNSFIVFDIFVVPSSFCFRWAAWEFVKDSSAWAIFDRLSVKFIWFAMFWVLVFGCWDVVCWELVFVWFVGVVVPFWFGLFFPFSLFVGLNGLVVRGVSGFVKLFGSFLFLLFVFVEDVEGFPPVKLSGFGGLVVFVLLGVSLF